MRKVFIVALALLMTLVGMSVAAESTTTTALTTGNRAVMFNNGYTGFCIDRLLDGASTKQVDGGVDEIQFAVQSSSTAMSNKYNTSIEQYLKAAIVEYHNTYFPRTDNVGGYYDAYQNGSNMNFAHLAWVFSDFEYEKITSTMDKTAFEAVVTQPVTFNTTLRDIIVDVRDRVDSEDWTDIPDHGYRKQIDADTYAVFDFAVMNPGEAYDTVQHFFSFKVTYYREVEVDLSQSQTLILDASIPSTRTLSYVWEEVGATDPVGCTDGKCVINPVSDTHHLKMYRCSVKDNYYGYTHYAADYYFTIRVKGATDPNHSPEIITPISDHNVIFTAEDEKIELVSTATDADGDTLTFTWYKYVENSSSVVVLGAVTSGNTSTLTLDPSAGDYDGKVYYCEVTDNKEGTEPDQSAKFTLKELSIAWSSTPEDSVSIGGEAVLSVTAQNASKIEWYVKRGDGDFEKIADETGTSLTINPVTMEDDGSEYYCKAINGDKEATTQPTIKLSVLPMEVTETKEIPYRIGDAVTLTKDDDSSKKYTWYEKQEDGTVQMMPGVTAHAIILSNRALAHDGDVYYCVAQDSDGLVSCTEFTLKLLMDPPIITTPEESTEIPYFPGETVTLTVTAENAKEYQWMVDKGTGELEEIPDANENSYTTEKLGDEQDGWVYVCRVSNEQDTVLTSAFILCKVELPQMPSTGDASMMRLWMILMIGAASALASLLSKKRGMTR